MGDAVTSSAAWYLALFLIGVTGVVPAAVLFERLPSRGLYLARPLALAVTALVTWLIVHLTAATYGTAVVLASVGLLGAASVAMAARRASVVGALVERWRWLAAVEAVTLGVFVVVVLVRMQAPDAWATEKPVDLMFLQAVHRATEFPPPDPWLSGSELSYYHLGQVQVDHVARIAGVSVDRAFNLATAGAAAMAAAAAAGLAVDVVQLSGGRRRRTALIAGAVALGGLFLAAPLAGLVQVLAAHGMGGTGVWGALGVEGVPTTEGAAGLVPAQFWWWWPTTRVVPGVISEYPAFTVMLGDPHAHLLALPLGITALALAVQVFEGSTPLGWRRWFMRPEQLVLTALVFAALVMTNSWDVITYGGLWGVAAWWNAQRAGWPLGMAAFIACRWALTPVLLALVLAWPFLQTLDPNPLGVAPVADEHSDPVRWLLFWLPVLAPALVGTAAIAGWGWRPRRSTLAWASVLVLFPVAMWAARLVQEGTGGELSARGWGWATIAGLGALVAWTGATAAAEPPGQRARSAALWLACGALAVLLLTELVHVDDAFPGRLNTAFKFWFHAWAILAVAGGALVGLASERVASLVRGNSGRRVGVPITLSLGRVGGLGVAGILGAVWVASMVTPPAAVASRAREGQEVRLSSTAYLEAREPGVTGAFAWAEQLDPTRDVVAEAVGESYGRSGRFSAFTAVPTILGWPGHERQWRGEIEETARRAAVDAIYGPDEAARAAAIEAWGVTHVLVGVQERLAYGADVDERFAGWPVAYSAGETQIFAVPASDQAPPR